MPKQFWSVTSRTTLTVAMAVVTTAASHHASAGVLSVTNGDFEAGTTPNGSNLWDITDWYEALNVNGGSGTTEQLLSEATSSNIPADAGDDQFWGHLTARGEFSGDFYSGIYQQVGVYETGDSLDYRLDALLGDRSNAVFGTLKIEFYAVSPTDTGSGEADGTRLAAAFDSEMLLASDTPASPDGGSSTLVQSYSEVFDLAGITSPAIGDEIWLRIYQNSHTENVQALIDDVTLAAVPEPGAMALVAAGGVLAFGRRRKKA